MKLFAFRAELLISVLAGALFVALPASVSLAEITVGQVDDFQDSAAGWLGANVEVVPGAGPSGAADHALRASATGTPFGPNGKLLAYNDVATWTGNWTAAGVFQISMDVRNPNAVPLSMRLAIAGPDGFFAGGGGETHATDAIAVAADDAWHSITFDVQADDFTPLTTAYPDPSAALAEVTHLRILHHPEHSFVGEAIDADFLIDNIRTIGATTMVAGDYNENGTVDAADYVVWRKTLNQSVPNGTGADGTGPEGTPDGLVNNLDYEFWRSQFGASAGGTGSGVSAAAVPEPTTWSIFACLATALLRRRR